MKSFQQFFLEYRHNLADGTPSQSIQPNNSKNPNNFDKKKMHTVGPYKVKDEKMHSLGSVYQGRVLMDMLDEYNLDFEEGQVTKIKNSPYGLQMFMNHLQLPAAKVVKIK